MNFTDEQIAAFEGLDVVQAKFYFDRRNADGRTHREMVEALLSASKPAAQDDRLTSAIELMKRLKRDLMHARRFGVDTLANYRRACSSAEGDVEEWLNENTAPQPSQTAVVLDDERAALSDVQVVGCMDAADKALRGRVFEGPGARDIAWAHALIEAARASSPQPVVQPVEHTTRTHTTQPGESVTRVADLLMRARVLEEKSAMDRARLDRCVSILSRIHSFLLPDEVRLPDGRVFEFSNEAIEREMLRGLCKAIRAVPDELAAQPVEQTRALTDEQADDLQEAREILENMVRSVELDGNYSTEATCTFLRQALQCLPAARPASGEPQ